MKKKRKCSGAFYKSVMEQSEKTTGVEGNYQCTVLVDPTIKNQLVSLRTSKQKPSLRAGGMTTTNDQKEWCIRDEAGLVS